MQIGSLSFIRPADQTFHLFSATDIHYLNVSQVCPVRCIVWCWCLYCPTADHQCVTFLCVGRRVYIKRTNNSISI